MKTIQRQNIQSSQIITDEELEILESEVEVSDLDDVIKIPVVVHIIHNNSSGVIGGTNNPNISDEQVYNQINVLNEDFRRKEGTRGFNTDPRGADTKIEFQLAKQDPEGNETNGIIRVYHSRVEWDALEDTIYKRLSYWPSTDYLNIWIINLGNNDIGYARFPTGTIYPDLDENGQTPEDIDGVVLDYTVVGIAAKGRYRFGRTCTHEVGHWFGLYHNFADVACASDFVDDTPPQETSGDALTETCMHRMSNCNGVSTLNMTNNYMDYSPDVCMNIFTLGQKERMRKVILTGSRRKSLLHSIAFDTTVAVVNGKEISNNIKVTQDNNIINIYTYLIKGSGKITVSNILAGQVYTANMLERNGNSYRIDAANFSQGIYTLTIEYEKEVYFWKICIN